MFAVDKRSMKLTKGDTAYLTVRAYQSDGSLRKFNNGDNVKLTVRELPNVNNKALFTASATGITTGNTECTIKILPSHTRELEVGIYSADIELITVSGDVFTLWPQTVEHRASVNDGLSMRNFMLMPDVTIEG